METNNNLIDIHTHILPLIDDGADSFDESIKMLMKMEELGVGTVVATPHFSFEKNEVKEFSEKRDELIKHLKELIDLNNINVEVLSGAEVMYCPSLNQRDLDNLVIENTDYILIELSTRRNHSQLESTMSSLIARGYIPIIAHVERYAYLIENSQTIVRLINMGVIFQMNVSTLDSLDRYPYSKALIKNNLVHLIGSDTHNLEVRKPNLGHTEESKMFNDNAQLVISNKLLLVKEPKKLKKLLWKYF